MIDHRKIAHDLFVLLHEHGGGTLELESGVPLPPGFPLEYGEPKRFPGKKVTKRDIREFMWINRKKENRVIWIVYDPNLDSSYLGFADLTFNEVNNGSPS